MATKKTNNEALILQNIDEFLSYYQFKKTLQSFKEEASIFQNVDINEWRPVEYYKKKAVLLESFKAGKHMLFFQLLEEIVPETIRADREYKRLEFEFNLYLATLYTSDNIVCFIIEMDHTHTLIQEMGQKLMSDFRKYLETSGSSLSQSTDLLQYYALPYVPNPRDHPVYQQLFKESWRNLILLKLSTLLDNVLQPERLTPPRLVKLLTENNTKRDRTVRQLKNELMDAEKRASQSQRRYSRLQLDYQTLISVSGDLLDALENSLKGIKIEEEVMKRIYSHLINNQSAKNLHGSFTTNASLRESIRESISCEQITTEMNVPEPNVVDKTELPLFELDYAKIKNEMQNIDDRRKCYLLQALRWRLTKSTVHQREHCLTAFVRHDLLDLTRVTVTTETPQTRGIPPLLACLHSQHHRVREYMARFINSLASLCRGRAYLTQNRTVVKLLIDELVKEHDESITRENFVGALQKISLRRPMQTIMINYSVLPWVIAQLETTECLSDYTLEYAVALCMNLCLRTAGKRACVLMAPRVLKVLVNLLSSENIDIVPYINGALYSILTLPDIRRTAESMNLHDILESFIQPNRPELNRQFEFIIRRLRSDTPPPPDDSDDELDDEDDEEDPPQLEADLDRQDLPAPDPSDLRSLTGSQALLRDPQIWVGEGLLKHSYSSSPVVRGEANGGVDWCKPLLSREPGDNLRSSVRGIATAAAGSGVLYRPTTPSQRSMRSASLSLVDIPVDDSNALDEQKQELPASVRFEPIEQGGLRDSQATVLQNSSAETTPLASIDLEDVTPEAAGAVSEPQPIRIRQTGRGNNKKEAFESRPKIPRTPESGSPARSPSSQEANDGPCSPDSTVSSTSMVRAKDVDVQEDGSEESSGDEDDEEEAT